MTKTSAIDREILARALELGGLSVITHRYRREVPESVEYLHKVNRLVIAGLLRQTRISGDKNDPGGERRYDYELTAKGQVQARIS